MEALASEKMRILGYPEKTHTDEENIQTPHREALHQPGLTAPWFVYNYIILI